MCVRLGPDLEYKDFRSSHEEGPGDGYGKLNDRVYKYLLNKIRGVTWTTPVPLPTNRLVCLGRGRKVLKRQVKPPASVQTPYKGLSGVKQTEEVGDLVVSYIIVTKTDIQR